MRRVGIVIGLLGVALGVIVHSVQSRPEPKKQDTKAPPKETTPAEKKTAEHRAADEEAIRANITAFVRAFNRGDAKTIAALFTPDGQAEDKEGNISEGREAIEKTFKEIFAESPRKRLELTVESIRFLGADIAVETGSTKETDAPGETPEYDRYTVVHVKRDGKWQMALARDQEGNPPSSHEELKPLEWLVGDWIDDGGRVVARSTCRWSEDGHFLLQDFNLQIEGKDAMKVTQRIGWDPLAKRIRSWVFDSEGGFGESVWSRNGKGWIIKATAVRPDGKTASATNVLIPTGRDAYVWRSTDRIVGDEVTSPIEVKIIRKPPQPNR